MNIFIVPSLLCGSTDRKEISSMNIKNIYDCSYGLDWVKILEKNMDWTGLGPKLIGLDWSGLRKLDPCPTLAYISTDQQKS